MEVLSALRRPAAEIPRARTSRCGWCAGGIFVLVAVLPDAITGAKPLDPNPAEIVLLGSEDGTSSERHPGIASLDTTWIGDWTFDASGSCDMSGWETRDMHIQNDGELHWSVDDAFDGNGGITGNAAIVGEGPNLCWEYPYGYGNDWYEAVRIEYSGSGWLSFDYALDAELIFDVLRVEADEECASFDRVDFEADPWAESRAFRTTLWEESGVSWGRADSIAVPNFGSTATHCLYIAFESDGSESPEDGLHPPTLGVGAVIDNIELVHVDTPLNEDFEQALDPAVSFFDMHESKPFGLWARLYQGPADNDPCDNNPSCAWIFTDPTLAATDSVYGFGPGGRVTRPRLDNALISPWISIAGLEPAKLILSYRAFGGTDWFKTSLTVRPAVRGRQIEADSVICTSSWVHDWSLDPMHRYVWDTFQRTLDDYIDPAWDEIQVRLQLGNHWCPGAGPCTIPTGPGPYIDRVRIGALDWCGPEFVNSLQYSVPAQDGFPTSMDPVGGYPVPADDIFGTVAFSGTNVWPWSTEVVPGDSTVVTVRPGCTGAAISSVEWYGVIVAGPHAGKAPPPFAVEGNGFFPVPVQIDGNGAHFMDLDDDYFRGGDVLEFFWVARDADGGFTSFPPGMAQLPASIEEARQETGGLLEWSALPQVDWSSSYLLRIAGHPSGKLDPTPEEIAGSSQANCILYVQQVAPERRSSARNRTSLMYVLDQLGLGGKYDVYDQSIGINNHPGGRVSVAQAAGYSLILYDTGNRPAWPGHGVCFTPLLPDDFPQCSVTVDQAGWFRQWLDQAPMSDHGMATLWLFGSNIAEERANHPLLSQDMGVMLDAPEQALGHHPDVVGQGQVTWFNGETSHFDGRYALEPGCRSPGNYDAIEANGTAIVSHRFSNDSTGGAGATVINTNPDRKWNTVLSSFAFPEARDADGYPDLARLQFVMQMILQSGVLQPPCRTGGDPVDALLRESQPQLPKLSAVQMTVPNPANPETTIRFDLARDGFVSLEIYDVAGRRIRGLIAAPMTAGFDRRVRWNGRDDRGRAVASGMYIARLETGGETSSRKLILVK